MEIRKSCKPNRKNERALYIHPKKGLARAARGGESFNTLTLYIAKVSIFVLGGEKGSDFSGKNFFSKTAFCMFLRIRKRSEMGRAGENIA